MQAREPLEETARESGPAGGGPASPRLFVVAGEPSGDLHAAHLLRAIRARAPGATFTGFGGRRMRDAGLECLEDLPAQAIMGLFPVLAALPRIRRWFRDAVDHLVRHPPDAILLVDYPGFNLRLAARAHRLGIPVIYFISPQVWAWNTRRVRRIARDVDLMLAILPFEVDFYRRHGLEVFYAGHPLAEHLATVGIDEGLVDELRRGAEPVVGIFPGSRRHVVDSLWPVFARVIRRLAKRDEFKRARFLVAAADEELAARLATRIDGTGVDVRVVSARPYEVMRAADLAITTSGTTTLELAAHETPLSIGYRVSPVLWLLGRLLVRVPHIGLVNLIAGREVAREHVGVRSFDGALARDVADLWTDQARRARMIAALGEVKRELGPVGTYDRYAARVVELLGIRR